MQVFVEVVACADPAVFVEARLAEAVGLVQAACRDARDESEKENGEGDGGEEFDGGG